MQSSTRSSVTKNSLTSTWCLALLVIACYYQQCVKFLVTDERVDDLSHSAFLCFTTSLLEARALLVITCYYQQRRL